jgi:hypothetical protein
MLARRHSGKPTVFSVTWKQPQRHPEAIPRAAQPVPRQGGVAPRRPDHSAQCGKAAGKLGKRRGVGLPMISPRSANRSANVRSQLRLVRLILELGRAGEARPPNGLQSPRCRRARLRRRAAIPARGGGAGTGRTTARRAVGDEEIVQFVYARRCRRLAGAPHRSSRSPQRLGDADPAVVSHSAKSKGCCLF